MFAPFDRVQQVDVVTTPAMAGLNLTELVLQSSAGGGTMLLGPEDAATILERVRLNQPLVPLMHR
ncbi:MAG: PH domain-containing protein [Thermomicrobiales bacterium]